MGFHGHGLAHHLDYHHTGRKMNRFCLIPNEIVENILLRVDDIDSLTDDCRFVCKSWFNLINDPLFSIKHHQYHKNAKKKKMVSFLCLHGLGDRYNHSETFLSLVTVSDDFHCHIEKVNVFLEIRQRLQISHCNGIIHMFSKNHLSSLLFNPTIRGYKFVRGPDPPPNSNVDVRGSGFGYDAKSNIYKLVKIFGDVKAMVHTLGTSSSSWREVKFDHLEGKMLFPGIYCKGAYYWLCRRMNGVMRNRLMILCFEMCDEKFGVVPIPIPFSNEEEFILGEWNESVALLNIYQMWVMVDDGIRIKWILCLKFGPLPPLYFPMNFWKEDEILLKSYRDEDGVVSYNIRTKQLRRVYVPGRMFYCTHAIPSLKTLFSV
ncbi:hypothetical protein CsatB_013200 [Cannabis sativa]